MSYYKQFAHVFLLLLAAMSAPKADQVSNEVISHLDWLPTLLAAAVAQFKATFKDFPQRQKPGSFVP